MKVSTSTDYGATFTTETSGSAPGGAFALSRLGPVVLAGADGELLKASSFGGSFGSVTGGSTTATHPIAARIPWYKIGKKSLSNNGASPDFYKASAAPISTESLWKVIVGTPTAITPAISGTKALASSNHAIGTYSANRICFIADVSGTRYIFVSTNSGSTWSHVTVTGALSVRAQRFSPSGLVWIAGTSSDIRYSSNGGSTWPSRTVSGGALFCELHG